jgi:pyruvate ferredoxin oxidoreductase delta subunit
MKKEEPIWKRIIITGRMNAVRLSEIYGEDWEEEAVRANLARSVASWRVFKPVLDHDKCVKCWVCLDYCPDSAIMRSEEGPFFILNVCKGCGICAKECPVNAIEMVRE